ncbi:MAG: glycoside hydrolase family 18 protein [Defluviitaleaceae bacterium]|nr:glycoside hydrolase family 18 protein [Defluviitaleaceae bacterium]
MERRPFIAAYLYGRTPVTPEDAKILDRINWAFGLCVDGKCSGAHWTGIEQLATLKKENPHLKTILSVGGWGAGGFSDAYVTHAGREKFAQSAVELMLEHDFDGIDMDWEFPCLDDAGIDARPEDKFNFTKVMWLMRTKLDAVGYVNKRYYHLSMACGCGSPKYAYNQELAELGTFLDEVNLMTYDWRQGTSKKTGHHTNLFNNKEDKSIASAKFAIDMYVEHGVPIEKLVIGGAFYGRGWTGVEAGPNGTGINAAASGIAYNAGGGYKKLVDPAFLTENNFTRHWDDDAKAPYLYNGDVWISYDDADSVAHKMKYVMERGMKGFMYWEYSGDDTGVLLKSLDGARNGK